jgi:hypothetical protein
MALGVLVIELKITIRPSDHGWNGTSNSTRSTMWTLLSNHVTGHGIGLWFIKFPPYRLLKNVAVLFERCSTMTFKSPRTLFASVT